MTAKAKFAVALLIIATLVGVGWYVVRYSPLLVVQKISITGVQGPLVDQVRTLVTVPKGTPLVTVDDATIKKQIEKIPSIKTASIRRGWPNTLVVAITLRTPIAWASGSTAGVNARAVIIDDSGVVITKAASTPNNLVEITVNPVSPGGLAALNVYQALPQDLKALVVRIGSEKASSIDSVTLYLKDKSQVLWGSSELMARKADVLRALLVQKADRYDVSAPDLPTTVTR